MQRHDASARQSAIGHDAALLADFDGIAAGAHVSPALRRRYQAPLSREVAIVAFLEPRLSPRQVEVLPGALAGSVVITAAESNETDLAKAVTEDSTVLVPLVLHLMSLADLPPEAHHCEDSLPPVLADPTVRILVVLFRHRRHARGAAAHHRCGGVVQGILRDTWGSAVEVSPGIRGNESGRISDGKGEHEDGRQPVLQAVLVVEATIPNVVAVPLALRRRRLPRRVVRLRVLRLLPALALGVVVVDEDEAFVRLNRFHASLVAAIRAGLAARLHQLLERPGPILPPLVEVPGVEQRLRDPDAEAEVRDLPNLEGLLLVGCALELVWVEFLHDVVPRDGLQDVRERLGVDQHRSIQSQVRDPDLEEFCKKAPEHALHLDALGVQVWQAAEVAQVPVVAPRRQAAICSLVPVVVVEVPPVEEVLSATAMLELAVAVLGAVPADTRLGGAVF
mmetsp:Transcript_95043/g.307600  ORF Transcript_95043/g.307600 Transcript_95043/m.307600 type:complete len:450 (+) Transcript_95043:544-1893(+)